MLKDIDGKKVPVVEVKYTIDYPEYKKLHNGILNAFLNDDKAIMSLSRLFDEDAKDITDEIKEAIEDISELDLKNNLDVTIDIDALTNKLVNFNVTDSKNEINYKEKSSETRLKISIKDFKQKRGEE